MKHNELIIFTLVFLLFSLILLVVSFYHISTGDEPSYLYQIHLMNSGAYPGKDFFAPYPFGFYWGYAWFTALLPKSLEAGRLLGVIATVLGAAMMTACLYRHRGPVFAYIGFIILGLNIVWVISNVLILTTVVSNFGLMLAYFFLAYPRTLNRWSYFLAGIGMGLAFNARFIIGPVVFVVFFFAFMIDRTAPYGKNRWKVAFINCFVAGIGMLIPSMPDLYNFFSDPSFFIYTKGGAFAGMYQGQSGGLATFLSSRGQTLWDFFFITSYHTGPQNLLFLVLLGALVLCWVVSRFKQIDKAARLDSPAWLSVAFLAAILGVYAIPDFVQPGHLRQTIPFLILFLAAGFHLYLGKAGTISMGLSWKKYIRWPLGILILPACVSLFLYVLSGGSHLAWQVLFRHAEGMTQVMTATKVACWLEAETSEDDRIVDFFAFPTVIAKRKVPDGMSLAVQLLSWFELPDESLHKIGAITLDELDATLRSGEIPIIISGPSGEIFRKGGLTGLPEILKEKYVYLGSVGGKESPYQLYIEKTRYTQRHGKIKIPDDLNLSKANLSVLRSKGPTAFLDVLMVDIALSLSLLPRDITASFARLFGGSFEQRCNGLYSASQL